MKKLAILAMIACFATSAFAQGDMGVFTDPACTQTVAFPPAFTTTNNLYMGFLGTDDVAAWEASVNFDPNIVVLATILNPPSAINVGTVPSYIVGTGTCLPNNGGKVQLATFTYGVFVPTFADLLVCVGGAVPSSFPTGEQGYLDCGNNLIPAGLALNGFPNYPDGCAVLNPTAEPPVGTDASSFGSIKGKF